MILEFLINLISMKCKRTDQKRKLNARKEKQRGLYGLVCPLRIFTNYLRSSVETHPKDRFGQSHGS